MDDYGYIEHEIRRKEKEVRGEKKCMNAYIKDNLATCTTINNK